MKIPKAFETALQNKEELVLIASPTPFFAIPIWSLFGNWKASHYAPHSALSTIY